MGFKVKDLNRVEILNGDTFVGGIPTKKTINTIANAIGGLISMSAGTDAYKMHLLGDGRINTVPVDAWDTVQSILAAAPGVFIEAVDSGIIFPQMLYGDHLIIDGMIADTRERAFSLMNDMLDVIITSGKSYGPEDYCISDFLTCVSVGYSSIFGCDDDAFITAVLKNAAEFLRLEYLHRLDIDNGIDVDQSVKYRIIEIIDEIASNTVSTPNSAKMANRLLGKIHRECTIVGICEDLYTNIFYTDINVNTHRILESHKMSGKLMTCCYDTIAAHIKEMENVKEGGKI